MVVTQKKKKWLIDIILILLRSWFKRQSRSSRTSEHDASLLLFFTVRVAHHISVVRMINTSSNKFKVYTVLPRWSCFGCSIDFWWCMCVMSQDGHFVVFSRMTVSCSLSPRTLSTKVDELESDRWGLVDDQKNFQVKDQGFCLIFWWTFPLDWTKRSRKTRMCVRSRIWVAVPLSC